MRLKARTDRNQAQIVRELRQLGAKVYVTSSIGEGFPDLIVGMRGKIRLVEVKDPLQPPSRRRLTVDESAFHEIWRGYVHVAETTEEIVRFFND